jgi:hypothetical protein
VKWGDAQVVTFFVLCGPGQEAELLDDVRAALGAVEQRRDLGRGGWVTAGIRLRPPRDQDEADLLVQDAQPDDPMADERQGRVLEIGGRGSARATEVVDEAVQRALCPDEFHPGPCRIPWSSMGGWLFRVDRRQDDKRLYRDLFPRATHRQARHRFERHRSE